MPMTALPRPCMLPDSWRGRKAAYSYMVPQMWRLFGDDNPELTYAFVLFEHCGRVRCAAKRR
ncbi:hypothetical protein [Pannonibacter indicus]|uniref:hypothetical protein n=1 Tax=Pannonibacter indicus TaxID=466044 RepID=UPI00391B6246